MAAFLGAMALPAPAARAADKVSVSALTFVSSAPLFIAQDRGHFAKEGLEVEIKFFAAAQPVAVAVTSGDVDFGTTGLTAGLGRSSSNFCGAVSGGRRSSESASTAARSGAVSNSAENTGFAGLSP